MNEKLKLFLKTFIICSFVFALFVGTGYFYLTKNISEAKISAENIPYTQKPTQNKGLLVLWNGESTFLYLDFLEDKLTVSLMPEDAYENQIYGYSHDYTINGNNDFLAKVVDCVGGVELNIENEKLRYTGMQTTDLLKRSDSLELRREIIKNIAQKISEEKADNQLISTIINNSQTELKFSECYFWQEYLQSICKNLQFID